MNKKYFYIIAFLVVSIIIIFIGLFALNKASLEAITKNSANVKIQDTSFQLDKTNREFEVVKRLVKRSDNIMVKQHQKVFYGGIVYPRANNQNHRLIRLLSKYYADMEAAKEWQDKKSVLRFFSEKDIFLMQRNHMTKIKTLENYSSTNNNSSIQNISAEKVDFDLSELKKIDFGTMYLFDLFGDSCSHGDKVYDVVKQILNLYKLDSAIQNVILRPVNYFSNIEIADSLYYEYYKNYIDEDYTGGKKNLATNIKSSDINIDETPTNYLEAIYTTAIDTKPDIISSSYKGTCGLSYIEKSLANENTYTNYLTAALNDPPYNVDSIKLKERVIGSTYTIIEPIASYISGLNDRGSIIVGNQVDSNKFMGMYSSSGRNITALGKGIHWGNPDCTRCIDSLNDVGTSFATPEVATKLLIAKAWWRKRNSDCDAIEARKRLILAANLNEHFIGKFASGGNISLNKLLQTDKGYLVKNDDTVIPLDSILISIIMNADRFTKIKAGDNINEISGLYLISGKVAALKNEKSPKWDFIPVPTDLNIVAKKKNDQTLIVLSKEIFFHDYKQFVILK